MIASAVMLDCHLADLMEINRQLREEALGRPVFWEFVVRGCQDAAVVGSGRCSSVGLCSQHCAGKFIFWFVVRISLKNQPIISNIVELKNKCNHATN